MAIKQYDKIVASEIITNGVEIKKDSIIYATDIKDLYNGSDNIIKGQLIKAEHYNNLGTPIINGLNGTFGAQTFSQAINDKESGFSYLNDSDDNWVIFIRKSGTLKFTDFGNKGSNVDIFMIGGGGAGNKNGASGTGGFYPTTNYNKTLSLNTNYALSIGSGGTTNGASGGKTTGFGYTANGGIGGDAFSIKYYYKNWITNDWHTYHYSGREEYSTEINGISCRIYQAYEQVKLGDTVKFECDEYGNLITEYFTFRINEDNVDGMVRLGYARAGVSTREVYRTPEQNTTAGGILSDILTEPSIPARPSNEMQEFNAFDLITVGGPGSSSSASNGLNPGQGGGSINNALGTAFGSGANGIIMIRNHR